ncbi:hypothetical protein DL766_000966 [Monosporascus sp. MC13-8B]|uniref:Ribosome biogenesis regulatory protein n=1 Tax=Monosporascus cannonballus TaxID=155416 RepID=A0ABY0HEX1_9PEZI|nr:hypothetical protein DL762_003517 [Monosporascus cannonballus]RYO98603.1 hypothetical protein DL763_002133 [Monosporascus cannonballus]RYP38388.1 hypothetical protein DL766_000966 [Monosporascus sp. MC13-8B]
MATSRPRLEVAVTKPTPYTFDLGLLLANDPNPISTSHPDTSAPLEERLSAVARDGAQALINQLLTTAPLQSTTDGVLLTLPAPTTALPREKPVPAAKEPTKWERFAARKGIKPKTREARAARARTYDEEAGEWRSAWGHDRGGRAADRRRARDEGAVQKDWLVEVDERKEQEAREEGKKNSGGGGGGGGAKKRRKA